MSSSDDSDSSSTSSSDSIGSKLASLLGPTPGDNPLFSLASKYLPIAMLINDLAHRGGADTTPPQQPAWMGAAGPKAPGAPPSQSYYTYGASPQQAAAPNVGGGVSAPVAPTAPQMGVLGAASGGSTHVGPVNGPGSGRDDSINARLSDGEYVMDAETVAMLGDGSVEEGARRLDQLRENIRKHKGRALAKGKFSPDAKPAEHYMGGVEE
jgi:hypothetical protein